MSNKEADVGFGRPCSRIESLLGGTSSCILLQQSAMCCVHQVFEQMAHQIGKLDNLHNEQGGAKTWFPESQVISDAHVVFEDVPVEVVWDDVHSMVDQDGLLKQLALGRDNFVGEDTVFARQMQVSIQASVVWDGAVQEALDELPCADVVWDKELSHGFESQGGLVQHMTVFGECLVEDSKVVWDEETHSNLHQCDDLLRQLAMAEPYLDDENPEMIVGLDIDKVLTHDLDSHGLLQHLALDGETEAASESLADGLPTHTMHEVFDGMPHEVVMWDELPADIALHVGLLRQLASGMECIDDKNKNPAVRMDTYQLSTKGVSQEGISIILTPINKWSDSFGDLESMEHMTQKLGAEGYQLSGYISSDLAVLDIRQEAYHACKLHEMQSLVLGDFSLWHQINNKSFKSEIYDDAYQIWDPGILRSATSGIHNNSSLDQFVQSCDTLLNGWSPYLPQSDEIKTLMVFLEQSMNVIISLQQSQVRALTMVEEEIVYWLPDARAYFHSYAIRDTCWLSIEMLAAISSGKVECSLAVVFFLHFKLICSDKIRRHDLQIKMASSVRRQWDPGIIQFIMQWVGYECKCCNESYSSSGCYDVVWKEFLNTTTAWGQAVFRGGGNVMTQIWPGRSPRLSSPFDKSQPKRRPKSKDYITGAMHMDEESIIFRNRNREGTGGCLPPSTLLRSYPSWSPCDLLTLPELISPVSNGCYNLAREKVREGNAAGNAWCGKVERSRKPVDPPQRSRRRRRHRRSHGGERLAGTQQGLIENSQGLCVNIRIAIINRDPS